MSDSKVKKKQMMDKARVLFTRLGYSGASMKNLAEAFGCKPANIYNYFDSKEDLLFEVLREEMEQIVQPVAHLEFDEIDDPLKQLLSFMQNHARVTLGYRRSAKMLFDTELGHLSPAKRKVIVDMRRQYDRILGHIIQVGIDQNIFRPTNTKLAAYGIASMIARSRVWYSPRGGMNPDQVGEFFFRLVVNGLRGGDL
ncbi:MAG: TetR/AcrR family transcriptional regulator [Desulfarculaceae bacterium]|nr:TetR/AcrR family transcriptional regulator [Desulfarculaceae bacterium]MCF8071176.1 TetR/AcrR family transcriptional regulator [Desulfarculaceae bacterium]MCF8101221.1 TetR/AcrR family transcriptional regulator [Desulfarculaceae bacterium]MCF8115230.1 TetR/AcrR family transcriptional regulator [Desulfarculaceae bacterium]